MPPVLNFARISTQGKILLITSLYNSTKIKKINYLLKSFTLQTRHFKFSTFFLRLVSCDKPSERQ